MDFPNEFPMPPIDGGIVYVIIRRENEEMIGTGVTEAYANNIVKLLGQRNYRVEKWSVSTECTTMLRKVEV